MSPLIIKDIQVSGKWTVLAYVDGVFIQTGCWLLSAACLPSTGNKSYDRLPCFIGMIN